jgi:hypothetical protein
MEKDVETPFSKESARWPTSRKRLAYVAFGNAR